MYPLNKANEQANLWLREMMDELGIDDPQHALACLRAGLHALRDRLTVEEAAQLSAQLPLIIRGVYFENWRPTGKPLRIRKREEFLDLIAQNYRPRTEIGAAEIARATFHLLGRHVSIGELADIAINLPRQIAELEG